MFYKSTYNNTVRKWIFEEWQCTSDPQKTILKINYSEPKKGVQQNLFGIQFNDIFFNLLQKLLCYFFLLTFFKIDEQQLYTHRIIDDRIEKSIKERRIRHNVPGRYNRQIV